MERRLHSERMMKPRQAACGKGLHSKGQRMADLTNRHRLARGIEVPPSRSRPARYSPSSVCRSSAIECASASICLLLTWACSTADQINLNEEKAVARQGSGVSD